MGSGHSIGGRAGAASLPSTVGNPAEHHLFDLSAPAANPENTTAEHQFRTMKAAFEERAACKEGAPESEAPKAKAKAKAKAKGKAKALPKKDSPKKASPKKASPKKAVAKTAPKKAALWQSSPLLKKGRAPFFTKAGKFTAAIAPCLGACSLGRETAWTSVSRGRETRLPRSAARCASSRKASDANWPIDRLGCSSCFKDAHEQLLLPTVLYKLVCCSSHSQTPYEMTTIMHPCKCGLHIACGEQISEAKYAKTQRRQGPKNCL